MRKKLEMNDSCVSGLWNPELNAYEALSAANIEVSSQQVFHSLSV
jgi:hypothetical protein